MISSQFLSKIKERLAKQREDSVKHIEELKSQDPFNLDYSPAELSDRNSPDDEAQVNEMHDRITTQISSLEKQIIRIASAMDRIENGEYGKCDICGVEIDQSRLLIMPLTSMCLEHEKSMEKQVKTKIS